jgi:phosphatidylserine/phosphatidylglycerophosphate/cardiolipin synthase-like enzyme
MDPPFCQRFADRAYRLASIALVALASGCATLPSLDARRETHAITGTDETRLGRAVVEAVRQHPGQSGIYALTKPTDAFAARAILAQAAEKSLDVQYYIWHADQTGLLLFEAVWRAAERGVRVRMLLDDANTGGLDDLIAALAAHPNLEVRLYNPLVPRSARVLNFVTDFERANRRMHNKAFIADNAVTIVGGRNIGNEYFAAGEGVAFTDLDVMAVGAAVHEVSKAFDLYWNSASSYPATSLLAPAGADARAMLEAKFAAAHADPQSAGYLDVLTRTELVHQLIAKALPLDWAAAHLVRDDPAKTLDTSGTTDVLLLSELLPAIGQPNTSFDLVSPYFVPADAGTAALVRAAQRGVKVRVLTNSLAATDVPPVHAGYAKRRCELLRAGVRLYELAPTAAKREDDDRTIGSGSSTQLHAKTFALDRDRIFVGSFNFDPRSARLNTEMGLVIDSAPLAARLSRAFDEQVPNVAYEVRLAADGRCAEWIQRIDGREVRYDADPGTSAARRAWIDFLSILPIERLL